METGKRLKFLREDIYNFLGYKIKIKSNSNEVLAHIKSMYGRFLQSYDNDFKGIKKGNENTAKLSVEIIDNLASSNEFLINDSYYNYRLFKTDSCLKFTSQDLNTLAYDLVGYCDYTTLIQVAIIRTISRLAKDYNLFHAGAVSWENKGIIFPASSKMGKSTLALKLVMNGCKFLSDEVACFNLNKDIIDPFPRKINIRSGSKKITGLNLEPETMVNAMKEEESVSTLDIEDIVNDSLSGPCTPCYIIFLKGFGDKPRLEYIAKTNALFELLRFSISPLGNRALLLYQFAPIIGKIKCFNLVMGDIDETAKLVMQVVDGVRQ